MKAFAIDVGICNGCYCCQIACKDEHVGNDWTPYAKPQPDTGQFWMRPTDHIWGTVPKVKMHYIPIPCQHCDEAPCVAACPIEGAIYKRDDGLVIIDLEKCTGCKSCVYACPYNAIFFNEDLNIAQKCSGCAHLLDGGEWKVPRYVDVCPTEAIKFGEEEDFKDLIAKAEVLKTETKAKPWAYYLNIPKKFIAGTVYDPIEKEVIIGATCTLNAKDHKPTKTAGSADNSCYWFEVGLTRPHCPTSTLAKTDGFGDFWFEGLDEGTYSLEIEKDGKSKKIDAINTEKDVNLGDIPFP